MKKIIPLLLVLLAACTASDKKEAQVLSPKDFQVKLKATENAYLIDVRTPEEIESGKIAGATNIVFDENFKSKIGTVPHLPLFIYCAGGKRSAKAAEILRNAGYSTVYELEGGMNAWKNAGLEVQ